MSIRDWSEKIKSVAIPACQRARNAMSDNSQLYTGAIIVLVGLSSFGLGRLSILDENREPIIIENSIQAGEESTTAPPKEAVVLKTTSQNASVASSLKTTPVANGGKLVASKNGTKYYFPWCGSNIAEKNKIWFANEAEARAKGYGPAANCKGLK